MQAASSAPVSSSFMTTRQGGYLQLHQQLACKCKFANPSQFDVQKWACDHEATMIGSRQCRQCLQHLALACNDLLNQMMHWLIDASHKLQAIDFAMLIGDI